VTTVPEPKLPLGLIAWHLAIPAMFNLSVKVSELRIHYGPGYRVYFAKRGKILVVLLCGGDKSTQTKDIKAAKILAANLED
jgi:putative addiction module killer protein